MASGSRDEPNRLIDGRIARHARQEEDLIGTEAKEAAQRRIDRLPGPVGYCGQQIVEATLPAEDPVRQLGRQAPLLPREAALVELGIEKQAGIGSLLLYLGQHLEREASRVHAADPAYQKASPGRTR